MLPLEGAHDDGLQFPASSLDKVSPKLKTSRIGVLVTHPIQYYAPWFRDLAARFNVTVYYAYKQDAKGQAKAGFGVEFDWDVPLLDGYHFEWLQNVARNPSLSSFAGCDTPQIAEIIKKESFTAFLIIGWNKMSYWQAIRACWKYDVPVLMRGDSQLPQTRSLLKKLVKELPYRLTLPKIGCHLYVGERNREYLRHYGVRDSQLIASRHFVDNSYFETNAERAWNQGECLELRTQLGISPESLTAIFVGKLIAKKRPMDFIRAVLNVSEMHDVHGIVVGSGPLESECRTIAKTSDRIHFLGFRNQSQLPLLYRASDLLVLPSDGSETWGLVANEALACGTPCLLSDSSGCSADFVNDQSPCRSFATGDLNTLSSLLIEFSESKQHSTLDWRTNAKRVVKNYSIDAATKSIEMALETKASGKW